MTNIQDIIGPLIMQNDCIIIPSLGGFVANYVSAKIDERNGVFLPPSKALNFNKNLNTNDGLLIQFLAKEKNISYQEAQQIVSQEVQQIKTELDQDKRVHFNNVGFLYINNSGKIAFEQERFFNLLLSSYGLENIRFIVEEEVVEETVKIENKTKTATDTPVIQPIATIPVEEVKKEVEIIEHPSSAQPTKSKKKIGNLIKYAAAVVLLPILFYSLWIPMKTDVLHSKVLYLEDFNPFKKVEEAKYSPEKMDKESLSPQTIHWEGNLEKITKNLQSSALFSYPLDEDLFVYTKNISLKEDISILEEKNVSEAEAQVEKTSISNKYHAIVGCFSEQKNANSLIEELKSKGFDAYQVDKNKGLYRISAGSTNELSEMEILREKLSIQNHNSWVLKN